MTQAFHQPSLVVQRMACQERIPAHACPAVMDSASSFIPSNRAPASRPSSGPGANGQQQGNQESQKEHGQSRDATRQKADKLEKLVWKVVARY